MILAKRALLFAILWVALTGGELDALPVGVLVTGAACWISLRLFPPAARQVRWLAVVGLVPGFLWRSVEGGVDVARRAFARRMPLAPGWLRRPSTLAAGAPRMSLAAELSLLPGTLAAGDDADVLLVHCLDRSQPIEQQIAREEARIAATLSPRPE